MIGFIGYLITTFIYQPFFNLLVYIYLVLDKATAGQADMGWAVIIFTVVFRILIMPLSLRGERSEKERREIAQKVERVERYFRDAPLKKKEEIKKLFASNKKILTFEAFDLSLQVLIAVMLYRIFSTGLNGADLHLLYSFMPPNLEPFNLTFLNQVDLTHPSTLLNILTVGVIFLAEFLSLRFSPFPLRREDKVMLAVLPLAALTFFAFMPAGKKLFVISTLSFSIFLILSRQLSSLYHGWAGRGKLIS